MSTYNRVNWNTSKNLLTRENLNKMSEAIVTCASKAEAAYMHQDIKNLISTSEVVKANSNTIIVNETMKNEIYVVGQNLISVSTTPTTHRLIDHLNPLPSGNYKFYIYGSSTTGIPVIITSRRSRLENDPTDRDNLLTVFSDYISTETVYDISAPNGIDYITIEIDENDTTLVPVLLKEEDFTSITEIDYTVISNTQNIMPFPYMYEYWRHNPSSVAGGNTVIGNLIFSDLGDGGIKVIKTGEVENGTSFHFHYGTEVEFPADKYTFKCDIYDAETGELWTGLNSSNSVNDLEKAYGRFLARWEDGDSESYYQDTIQSGTTSSTRPAYNGEHFTFNAFNGIKSIVGSIYIHKGIKNFPSDGLIFRPTLTRGEVPTTTNFDDMPRNNTVYKYVTNLIRPKTPDYYVSGDGTGLGRGLTNGNKITANGITIENKGGGTFIVNGTASAYSTFIVNPGRYYLNPIGTLYFGNLSSNAPAAMELRMSVQKQNSSAYVLKYRKGRPSGYTGIIESTVENPMLFYGTTLIIIPKNAVCNNVTINWQLSLGDLPFERFEMPRGCAGVEPGMFENDGEKNFTFIGNPEYNLLINSWKSKLSKEENIFPYVIEQTNDNGWFWKKWNNNFVEAYGSFDLNKNTKISYPMYLQDPIAFVYNPNGNNIQSTITNTSIEFEESNEKVNIDLKGVSKIVIPTSLTLTKINLWGYNGDDDENYNYPWGYLGHGNYMTSGYRILIESNGSFLPEDLTTSGGSEVIFTPLTYNSAYYDVLYPEWYEFTVYSEKYGLTSNTLTDLSYD